MIKYYSDSVYDRGFLLELNCSGDITKAKALLVTMNKEVCLDIFSIPFDVNCRVISIPEWNLSFFYDTYLYTDFHLIINNHLTSDLSDIFKATIDIIHNLIDSLPVNISDKNLAEGNAISLTDDLLSLSTIDSQNQHLPF